jgi:hypothetical protein
MIGNLGEAVVLGGTRFLGRHVVDAALRAAGKSPFSRAAHAGPGVRRSKSGPAIAIRASPGLRSLAGDWDADRPRAAICRDALARRRASRARGITSSYRRCRCTPTAAWRGRTSATVAELPDPGPGMSPRIRRSESGVRAAGYRGVRRARHHLRRD